MRLEQITYADIAGLVARAEQQEALMSCTFRCTISFASVEASAPIDPRQSGVAGHVQERVRQGVLRSVRYSVLRAVRHKLGYGFFGRLFGELAGDAVVAADQYSRHIYTEEQKRAAVVRAFQQVGQRWRWDPEMRQWVFQG